MWESGTQKRMEPPTTLSNPPKLFLSSNLTIAQLICFFRWILESGGGGGEGVPKIGERFYAGWRGAHEESFKRIQFVSCHIDGSRWTD